nr:PREDICTED: cytochrome P450 82C2-like [Daucus carota subsp. sativus]
MDFSKQSQVIVLSGIVIFLTLLWRILSSRYSRSHKKDYALPEPPGAWPIIGHLHLLGANKLFHRLLGDMADELGPIFSLRLGSRKALVVSSWGVARECFTVHDKAFANRPTTVAVKIMGYKDSMIGYLPNGAHWLNLRKLAVVELLSNRRLDKLKHIPESEVNLFVRGLYDLWKGKGEGSMLVVELTEKFKDLTMNIMVRMLAGKSYFGNGECKNEESKEIQKGLEDYLNMAGLFMVSDAAPLFGWIDSLTGYKGKMKKTTAVMDNLLEGWVKEHKQTRKLSLINESEQDFIHVMLSIMESDPDAQISDTTIKGTCLTLLLGGYDTAMVTLTWTVSLLLNNRHVLRKVQDELDKHVGRDRQVNESDVKNLPYLRAIVKETLRLYPPAPLNGPHEAIEDCTLAGFHISAGTLLLVNLWKLQRDPSIWSDPLEFRPERFVEKDVDIEMWGQNFELIPFGSGRRACPGSTFAIRVLHLTLAQLLHGFELGTVSDLPIDMTEGSGITMPKLTPLEVTFKPRLAPSLYV